MQATNKQDTTYSSQSEIQKEEGWTESLTRKMSDWTAPLTERFETYWYGQSNNDDKESINTVKEQNEFQKTESSESFDNNNKQQEEEDGIQNDALDDGIMERLANLATPLSDFIDSYSEEEPKVVVSKENVFQKVKDRFERKKEVLDDKSTTWKGKIITSFSNLSNRFNVSIPVLLNGMTIQDWAEQHIQVLLASTFLVPLLILYIFRRAKRSQQAPRRRARTTSHDGPAATRNRARSTSFDAYLRRNPATRVILGGSEDPLEKALLTDEDSPLTFGGPSCSSISYETWSPPMQWSEASRMLLPVNTDPEQQRNVTLDFQRGTLTRKDPSKERQMETYQMMDLSIHVKTPATGGVLEIYIKGAPKDGWREHTFKSAHQAAQFQQDLVNYQVVGESIMNMYESLELIQKGSMAHDGKECVLHDDTSDTKRGAVAWDDCMRCFSAIKSLRIALDDAHAHNLLSANDKDGDETSAAVPEDYVKTRLLLGRFDFFRLFVPSVHQLALPQPESSPERVTELLERRKRVARASIMVQAYVKAQTVVNKGWNLHIDLPEDSFTKRLAYDEDIDNIQRDATATNEYYEATVSRDVRCDVHSTKHLEKHGSSVMSKYQAFSLVGSQVFKLPPKGERHPLSHRKDPVLSLPSLRKMMESYPDLDFFVCAFFPDGLGVAIVHVFVRSLPRGVDASFDTIMDRYMNGTAQVRDRKLEVFMQLGPGARLSPLAWGALKTVSLLLSWSRRGEAQIPFESGADRTPFPGMTMSNYMETTHFGAALQTNPTLPKNYVAVTTHVDPSKMNSAIRVLYQKLEEGGFPASIVDFTFVLEGEAADELPERALGNIRIVHLDALKVALPPYYSVSLNSTEDDESVPEDSKVSSPLSPFTPIMREMSAVWSSIMGSASDLEEPAPVEAPQNGSTRPTSNDPFQEGVDALRDILRGVTVPVRRSDVPPPSDDNGVAENGDDDGATEELVNVPVLSRTNSDDLRRYFRATGCDLKETAVRIVESAAWRGVTFPIDTRKCRVELQSGQFFQQGKDVDGDPVFYFQNMLMGPWRGIVDASVAALLHRLETSLDELSEENPDVKCTVIALVGKPFKRISKKKKGRATEEEEKDESSAAENGETAGGDGEQSTAEASVAAHTVDQNSWNPFRIGANPRVDPTEDFQVHTNSVMIDRLAEILTAHYPERLKRLILVPGQGRTVTYMNSMFTMRKLIPSSRTRSKVIHLNRSSELTKYVEDNELATMTGGWVLVDPEAFEC